MQKRKIVTTIYEYDSVDELSPKQINLIDKAKAASHNAYSPYSGFSVGVALLLENNKIIQGNNQENAAYPSGLCAERVALFYANSKYPGQKIIAMAIAVFVNGKYIDNPVPPCGACRQVLIETETRYESPIEIILYGTSKIIIIENSKQILPLFFNNSNLQQQKK